ncbi:hypothetical protein [Streptomyces sp. BH055]|uniref:hypothetical protein n=1 Tax=unclassified Streptomyces TaxID=2593676 RepID=UPI003BB787F1
MTDAPSFPSDLFAAQKRLHELYAEIADFPTARALPWSVEPLDGWEDEKAAHGGKVEKRGRPASPGWSDDDKAAYEKLWAELLETAEIVNGHRYFADFEGPDRVKERMRLKQAALPATVKAADVDTDAPAPEDLAQAV